MKKKFGIILRSYAKNEKDLDVAVFRAIKSIAYARELRNENTDETFFSEIVVLVPACQDCGSTALKILDGVDHLKAPPVAVMSVDGNPSSDVLNSGIELLSDLGINYATIVSHKAMNALTIQNMDAIVEAFNNGAKVVGIALAELHDIVMQGRLQNTFCCWDIEALQDVGGFDSKIGVEEITPLVRLIREHGTCVGVLAPSQTKPLDISKATDGIQRHEKIMQTKIERQLQELQRIDATFETIQSGIMPGYPKEI